MEAQKLYGLTSGTGKKASYASANTTLINRSYLCSKCKVQKNIAQNLTIYICTYGNLCYSVNFPSSMKNGKWSGHKKNKINCVKRGLSKAYVQQKNVENWYKGGKKKLKKALKIKLYINSN